MSHEQNIPPVTGVLLAAGAGTRLGLGPKALLRKANGQDLLGSAVNALLNGGCTRVLVVLGAQAERVAAQLVPDPRVTVLLNDEWETGMGSSFARGLAELPKGAAALVALVDQPGLSAELIHRVLAGQRPGRITAAGFRQDDASLRRGHPILFAPEHLGPAVATASGDAGARAYLAAHRELIDLVDCSDLDSGADIDTLSDLHLLGGQ